MINAIENRLVLNMDLFFVHKYSRVLMFAFDVMAGMLEVQHKGICY